MTVSKYNPNKYGRANVTHHIVKYYDEKGTFLMYGNGCAKGGGNCFSCILPDCEWDLRDNQKDMVQGGKP